MSLLLKYARLKRVLIIEIIICLTLEAISILLIPYFIAQIIDGGILQNNLNEVYNSSIRMILVSFFGTIFAVLGCYLCTKFCANLGLYLRNNYFSKTQELSIKDTEEFGIESLLARLTADVDNIQFTILSSLQMIVPAPLIIIACLILTAYVSPSMVIVPISIIVIFGVFTYIVLKKAIPISIIIQEKFDNMLISLREFFTGIRVIKAFDNLEYEKDRNIQNFDNYARNVIKVNNLFALLTPVAYLLMGITQTIILFIGSYLFRLNLFKIGQITSVTEYTLITIQYLIFAAFTVVMIPKAVTSANRVQEVVNKEPSIKEIENPKVLDDKISSIEFKNVTFYYDKSSEPVLNNINFKVEKGETLAIVGSTGSGKSTIVKLLLQFILPSEGTININDENINNLSFKSIKSKISFVPQKSFLFNGTIESNLRMGGGKDATITDFEKACANAQSLDFINNLDDKFNAHVEQGGTNFSGGQKQRLSISRALSKKADVYIFDDSFSALDYKTTKLLKNAIKQEYADKIKIIITQRISTIKDADTIIVMNEGKIVGKGTHKELLRNNTIYKEFAISQQINVKESLENE